uniref:Uncharacterized protein n=1 Tax=Glossina palpalis gambiensis TaxID=67801 RepID=A0A1B0APV6_9MUSC
MSASVLTPTPEPEAEQKQEPMPIITKIADVKCNVSETVRIEVEVNGNSTHIFNLTNNGKDITEKKNLCNNDNWEVIADVDAEKYRLIFQTITCTDGGFYNLTVVSNEPVMISHPMFTRQIT